MFQIELQDGFQAFHSVRLNGQWEISHKHNWKVRLFLCSQKLNKDFVVADFRVIKKCLREILESLENKNLNEIKTIGKSPTAELIARYIFDKISDSLSSNVLSKTKIHAVAVAEQPDCWAWYIKNNDFIINL